VRDNGGVPHDPHDDSTDPLTSTAHEELVDARRTPGDADRDSAESSRNEADPAESGADDGAEREVAEIASEQQVRVRRTPRYGRFMVLGGAVLGIASFIVTYSFPQGSGYDRNTVFGFVLVASVAVGVGLGAAAAILAAAATRRTERTVMADRIDVREPDAPSESSELPDLGELPAQSEHDTAAAGAGEPAAGTVGDNAATGTESTDGAERADGTERTDGDEKLPR
jgi:hypothetical protein